MCCSTIGRQVRHRIGQFEQEVVELGGVQEASRLDLTRVSVVTTWLLGSRNSGYCRYGDRHVILVWLAVAAAVCYVVDDSPQLHGNVIALDRLTVISDQTIFGLHNYHGWYCGIQTEFEWMLNYELLYYIIKWNWRASGSIMLYSCSCVCVYI